MRYRAKGRSSLSPPIDINVQIAKLKEGAAFDYQANVAYEKFAGIGDMNHQCQYCGALKWVGERPGLCCSGGKVRLPILDGPPEPLSALLMGTDPESKHFLSNIRRYNTSLSYQPSTQVQTVVQPVHHRHVL